MAINDLMTWEPKKDRWRKLYKGKLYTISCQKLGVPATKEASYKAANAWWQAKKCEIDGETPFVAVIDELKKRRDWLLSHGEAGRAADYDTAISDVIEWKPDDVQVDTARQEVSLPVSDVWQRIASPSPEVWEDRIERDRPESTPDDKTIKAQTERWLAVQEVKVKAGTLAPGTLRNNADCLRYFRNFMGDLTPVKNINEDRLEAFFLHLIGLLSDMSRDYALKCFGTSKAFIRYLVEKDLIPFPKNFESRSFKFNVSAQKIPTMTPDEFHLLQRHATGQMPLHLILMANCGFTQVDIAELTSSELRLDEGRIVRVRSKTRDNENVPEVDYKLWPETIALLERHNTGGPVVLLTERGKPWVYEKHVDGRLKSTDNIASNYKWVKDRIKKKEGIEFKKSLKLIRKTSATMLGSDNRYGLFLAQHFLGHSPRSVATRNYVAPPQALFDEAVMWLREQYRIS
jgi:integrase